MNTFNTKVSLTSALAVVVTVASLILLPMSVSAAKPAHAEAAKPSSSSIVDIVVSSSDFDVLRTAVIRAGLAGALDGSRQLTVFAPDDQAFINSLSGVSNEAEAIAAVNSLPIDALTDILLYHVTPGRQNSNAVLSRSSYRMLNGDRLTKATLLNANVQTTDISASNGVIHVIDSVLMP